METERHTKNTTLIIFIIVLIIIILGLGGYLVYKEFVVKNVGDKKTPNNSETVGTGDKNKEEVLDINDTLVQKSYNYFLYTNGTKTGKHVGSAFATKNISANELLNEEKNDICF